MRRLVAGLAAIVLVAEAAVLVLVHIVLGRTTANQSMSIAGSDPDVMSKATYAMGAGMGAFLVLCAVLAAVTALRDRAPGRFGRVALISAAVTHAVLGILAVGLVGWAAFTTLMLILCLLVLILTLYPAAARQGGEGDGGGPVEDAPPPPPFGELKPTSP
ncbi:membrane protein [Streptomyces sp. WM6373]|nr:membrane protein [Streptomyces sp. WM6373]KOV15132.1 membrane protein [Streptomyces sp. XY413]KOV29687.1 membrane protein [Streptomyces sp. H021]